MIKNYVDKKKNYFRKLGHWEAISFIVLLFIAMPLKYLAHEPMAVKIVGSLHGALFTLYIIYGLFYAKKSQWSILKLLFVYIIAVIPFGPFIFDKKIFP